MYCNLVFSSDSQTKKGKIVLYLSLSVFAESALEKPQHTVGISTVPRLQSVAAVSFFSDLTFAPACAVQKKTKNKKNKMRNKYDRSASTSPQSRISAANFIHLICVGTVF